VLDRRLDHRGWCNLANLRLDKRRHYMFHGGGDDECGWSMDWSIDHMRGFDDRRNDARLVVRSTSDRIEFNNRREDVRGVIEA
jgi:hypothetical protein